MPAYLCKCGSRVSVGDIPCEHQWNFISDASMCGFDDSVNTNELDKEMKMFFKCPSCMRLAMFWNGWENEPTFYTEDN